MFRFIWTLSVRTRDYLHRYIPSNRLLAAIRTRRGLKWGLPAMLVALPYFLIAYACSAAVADGGPGWLHLIVLWACWNALKFILMGPVSVVLLIRARLREAAIRRRQRYDSLVEASPREPALRVSVQPSTAADAVMREPRRPPGRITTPCETSARRTA